MTKTEKFIRENMEKVVMDGLSVDIYESTQNLLELSEKGIGSKRIEHSLTNLVFSSEESYEEFIGLVWQAKGDAELAQPQTWFQRQIDKINNLWK